MWTSSVEIIIKSPRACIKANNRIMIISLHEGHEGATNTACGWLGKQKDYNACLCVCDLSLKIRHKGISHIFYWLIGGCCVAVMSRTTLANRRTLEALKWEEALLGGRVKYS